jgi:capsular exopolysaccharide synthesis family protein
MSRIQDILAKAERDGTAGRLTSVTMPAPAPPPSAVQRVEGTSALNPDYAPLAEPEGPRTGIATLHPALVTAISPHSKVSEQYRGIRARLAQREEAGPVRSLVVTSPGAGDGKSITAANLALTMAQELQRTVVLVDTDLRGATVHSLFGLERGPGLAEVLSGTASLDDALVDLPEHGLAILPAGETPSFPAELLGSAAMRRLADTLRNRFDRIVFDAPAVSPLADTGMLAPIADGVVMVVRAGVTKRPALDDALQAFDEHKVLGVVLNGK